MNKLPLLLLATIVLVPAALHFLAENKDLYKEWKDVHGFNFNNNEDSYRRKIFQQELESIENFNKMGNQTYEIGINQFSHLTQEEWALIYLNKKTTPEV